MYGVPDIMIELICSLNDGMSVTVTVGGGKFEPFSVQNGLFRGCNIAPASRAFGNLCASVFAASDLTLETKRMVYRSVLLGELLDDAEKI